MWWITTAPSAIRKSPIPPLTRTSVRAVRSARESVRSAQFPDRSRVRSRLTRQSVSSAALVWKAVSSARFTANKEGKKNGSYVC